MRVIVFLAAVMLISACSDHTTPHTWTLKEAWRTGDFAHPESVVYDPERSVYYISNIAGDPTEKNGQGFISIISEDGAMKNRQWVDGLHGPKGMALSGERLYVADIDGLIEVDVSTGEHKKYPVADAQLLNDVTVDSDGNVYISDTFSDTIYILRAQGDSVEVWTHNTELEAPNGLYAAPEGLYVASWGPLSGDDFATTMLGKILLVSYDDQKVVPVFEERFGNLDGIEPVGDGHFLLSDWVAGKIFVVDSNGNVVSLAEPGQGSADFTYVEPMSMIIVPMMMDDEVIAYQVAD